MSFVLGAALALASMRGSLTLSDRSEARVRNDVDLVTNQHILVTDFDTLPSALLLLDEKTIQLTLTYAPRLTLRNFNRRAEQSPGFVLEVLQRASAVAAWHDRRTRVTIGEDATYGKQGFSALLSSQPIVPGAPLVERIPSQTILYGGSRTTLTYATVPARRWRFATLAEYIVQGGLDESARAVIPLQKGPRGDVSLERVVTKTDGLISISRGSYFHALGQSNATAPDATTVTLEQTETWRHRFDRYTESTLGIGVSEVRTKIVPGTVADEAGHWDLFLVLEGSLRHLYASDRVDARINGRLAPFFDRLTGRTNYQAQGTASVLYAPWNLRHGVSLRAQLGVAQSIPATRDTSYTILLGEAAVALRTSSHVQLETGVRAVEQTLYLPAPGPTNPVSWAVFFTATFTAERMRF